MQVESARGIAPRAAHGLSVPGRQSVPGTESERTQSEAGNAVGERVSGRRQSVPGTESERTQSEAGNAV
jgi:hypothetical protein